MPLLDLQNIEYIVHVCHGVTFEAEGSIYGLLNAKTADLDLTRIALDHFGKYPCRKIFQIIDGSKDVSVHGQQMMPIRIGRYSVDVSAEYAPR